MENTYISIEEIAKAAKVSMRTVWRWVKIIFPKKLNGEKVNVLDLPENFATGRNNVNLRKICLEYLRIQAMQNSPVTLTCASTNLPAKICAPVQILDERTSGLKDWQKDVANARILIAGEVTRLAETMPRNSTEAGIKEFIALAQADKLPENIKQLLKLAKHKAGRNGTQENGPLTVARRTLFEWCKALKDSKNNTGKSIVAASVLAPGISKPRYQIPDFAEALLEQYQRLQKPSLADAVRAIAPLYSDVPEKTLYQRAKVFVKQMGRVDVQIGRFGPREIKNLLPFIRRDRTVLKAGEMFTADGHCFDAEVAHPKHGRPFRPEISAFVDVASGRCVGWSVDLAESSIAVLDALRHAVDNAGIPAMLYVDNGPGYKNALMSDKGTGLEARLGFEIMHSKPNHSQSRGIIERTHGSVFVRAAKELPTYIGKPMDACAANKVHKITRKEIKESGTSRLLMSFAEFMQFINKHIEAFNNRPHRGLPKIADRTTGAKRHMTPNEVWKRDIDAGAEPVMLTKQESIDLFRPQVTCNVRRGEVVVLGNRYFSQDLKEWHGETLRASYDIHNADEVWIYANDGRFICNAEFESNKRGYVPETAIEKANEKRATARLRRLDAKINEVEAELAGPEAVLIENDASMSLQDFVAAKTMREKTEAAELVAWTEELPPKTIDQPLTTPTPAPAPKPMPAPAPAPIHVPAVPAKRPLFANDIDRYEWLMNNRDVWQDADEGWINKFKDTSVYRQLEPMWRFRGMVLENSVAV